MKYGVHTFTRGPTREPGSIATLASTCDRLGFDYYGVSDHVIVSAQIDSPYPYTEDGSWPCASDTDCIDCLTTLSFVAANTKRARLLTSVMVVPHRPPVLASQILATLDVLSSGRLTVGLGVGWMEEELVALGAPDYQRRGRLPKSTLTPTDVCGRTRSLSSTASSSRSRTLLLCRNPCNNPAHHGGEGPAARRRVARLGDGWYPACCNPRYPLDTVERFTEAVNDVRQRTEAGGRDPDEIALFVPWAKLGEPVMKDGKRMVFTGPTDAILEDIASFENGGLDVFIPSLIAPSVGEIVDNCEAFAVAIGMG